MITNIPRQHHCVARFLTCAIIVLHLVISTANAQERDSTLVQIETKDGNTYIGKIMEETAVHIRLESQRLGMLTIPKTEILRINSVDATKLKNNEYWFDNPQATRYLWAPNSFGLRKGEGYYQNIWVLFNQVSIGVTDYFSLGAGMVPLFLFAGGPTPVWITPKFSIPVQDNFNIGLGGLFGTVVGESDTGVGLLYGITTFGNRDRNLSIGLGYGYADGDLANRPIVTLSAMVRTGQRGYILTENYYLNAGETNAVLLSFAGRWIIKRAGLDFGLFIPTGTGGFFVAIPWLGVTVPFGNKN